MTIPKLVPDAERLLARLPERPPRREQTLDANRRGLRQAAEHFFGTKKDVYSVEDLQVHGRVTIPIRVYRPIESPNLPAVVYAHGGGWALGDIETHDRLCRALTNASNCVFISVGYRRPPEHPFPAAWYDVQDVLRHVHEQAGALGVDPARIALAGDSAGGQLAAATALWARDIRIKLAHLLLLMPDVDNHPERWPSHAEFDERYGIYADDQIWYYEQYFGRDWRTAKGTGVSPIDADLDGLPSTTILLAECDPVHDEGAAFARKLRASGVEVEVIEYSGMFHPFILFRELTAAREAELAVGAMLARRLTDPSMQGS